MSCCNIIVKDMGVKLHSRQVLADVCFHLRPGQHLAIAGASGSGKTTLLKALAGQLFYSGTAVITSAVAARPFIYLAEERGTFKNRSNLTSFYYQQRFNSQEAEDACTVLEELVASFTNPAKDIFELTAEINAWLQRFGLLHRKATPLLQLSNGEAKKFHLIKALLQQPDVLLLDEPFTGLDAATKKELQAIISDLSAQITIVMVAGHEELPGCITHLAQLEEGRLSYFGPVKKYKHNNAELTDYTSLPRLSPVITFDKAVVMRKGRNEVLV